VFLCHANRSLTSEQLIDRLWGDTPPKTAASALRVHIEGLRGATKSSTVPRLVHVGGGYLMSIEPGELDAGRFEDLLARGQALPREKPLQKAHLLRAGLALWNAEPCAGIEEIDDVDAMRTYLLRRHHELVVALAEAELDAGWHRSLVADLLRWVATYPESESLVAHLCLALYRCGDQVAALDRLRDYISGLIDDFGIDAGVGLRALETAILRQDASLAAPPSLGRRMSGPASGPTDHTPTSAVDDLLAQLAGAGRPPLLVVRGDRGGGKSTTLAGVAAAIRGAVSARPAVADSRPLYAHLLETLGAHVPRGAVSVEDATARLAVAVTDAGCPVLVIDDIDDVDPDTTEVLAAFVARPDPPASLVVSTDAAETAEEVGLLRHEAVRSVAVVRRLERLEAPEARDMLSRLLSGSTGRSTEAEDDFLRRAAGHPLALTLLARAISPDTELASAEDSARCAVAVLDAAQQRVLACASLMRSDVVDPDLLATALQAPSDHVNEALAVAGAAGVLGRVDRGLAFTNEVMRHAAAQRLSRAATAELHLAVAEILGHDPDVNPGAVAHHLREASPRSLPGDVAEWCAREADHLMSVGAPAAASERYADAITWGRRAGLPSEQQSEWLLRRTTAAATAGRLLESQQVAWELAALADATGDADAFTRAAIAAVGSVLPTGIERENAQALTRRALERVGPSKLALSLLEAAVRADVMSEEPPDEVWLDQAAATFRDALRRASDDEQRRLALLGLRSVSWRLRWSPERSSDLVSRFAAIAGDKTSNRLTALMMRTTDLIETCHLSEALGCAVDLSALGRLSGSVFHRWWGHVLESCASGALGDAARESKADAAARAVEAFVDPDLRAATALERDFGRALRLGVPTSLLESLMDTADGELPPSTPVLDLGIMAAGSIAGLPAEPSRIAAAWRVCSHGPYAGAAAVLATIASRSVPPSGEADALVVQLFAVLQPWSGRLAVLTGAGSLGPVDAYLAELASRLGADVDTRAYSERARVLTNTRAPGWAGFTPEEGPHGRQEGRGQHD